MFDIGFWELTVIAVVALIVIGPERLPKVARTVGLWVGRMRGMVLSVKADIDRELRAEELKKVVEEQAKSAGLHEIMEETREALDELETPDYLVKAEKPAARQVEKSADDNKTNQDNGGKS
jgi:sec-independent protein translocase protein TatB